MEPKTDLRIIYLLTGYPLREEEADLPPQQIDVSHIPLYDLQRIFHVGPNNRLLERRVVNSEKARWLEAYCAAFIDTTDYRWEFSGRWSDDN